MFNYKINDQHFDVEELSTIINSLTEMAKSGNQLSLRLLFSITQKVRFLLDGFNVIRIKKSQDEI